MRVTAEQIHTLLDVAAKLAYDEIELRVRKVLAKHPGWAFTMAMGDAFFWRGDDHAYRKWMGPVISFVHEFDDLKITGMPMMIKSATGPLIKDW